jgi:hypothetical protein
MRKLLLVVVALAAVAAGAWYLTRSDAGGSGGHSVTIDADHPLAFVPADTPFVFANLEAMPQATVEAFLQQSDPALQIWRSQFDLLDARLGADDANARGVNWLRAIGAEFKGKTLQQSIASLGLDLRGHTAFYGIGLVPVARLTLADPDAFRGFIARLEAGAGEKIPTGKVDDVDYWQLSDGDAPLRGVLALQGRHAVITVAPVGDDAALRALLGIDRPQASMRDGAVLAALNRKYGYSPFASGYVDSARLLALFSAPVTPVEAAFLRALEIEQKPVLEPVCQTELVAIAAAMPRLTIGYTTLEPKSSVSVSHLELRRDIAQDLMSLRAPMPGLGATEGAMMNFGLSLKLAQVPTLVNKWAGAVAAAPWKCPSLAPLNETFAEGRTQASNPALFAAAPVFQGLHAILTRFEMAGPASVPQVGGKLLIGSPNPAALIGMARSLSPELAQLQLAPDGEIRPVPALSGMPPDLVAHAAMTDTLLGLAVGKGEEATLKQAMTVDPAQQPLLVVGYTGAAFTRFAEQMQPSLQAIADPAERAETEQSMQMMRDMYALIDRVDVRVEFDADGVAIHQSATMR